ncbi:MAG: hypothetical protein WCV50_01265 [Patescibacteria group bacterium]|jgi:hypothetical protein
MIFLRYFIKRYWSYIINVCVGIFSLLAPFIFPFPKNIFGVELSLGIYLSVFSLFLAFILSLFLASRPKKLFHISLTSRKHGDLWVGNGTFDYDRERKTHFITNSFYGFIFPPALNLVDYKVTFEFKIATSCLGVIVRAVNSYDFIMLQIEKQGINPHVFLNGAWQRFEHSATNLSFVPMINEDKWYKVTICCLKKKISIQMIDFDFNREWQIPQTIVLNFPKGKPKDKIPGEEIQVEEVTPIYLPVNLDIGTIGFRNAGQEKAYIKNVYIESI